MNKVEDAFERISQQIDEESATSRLGLEEAAELYEQLIDDLGARLEGVRSDIETQGRGSDDG